LRCIFAATHKGGRPHVPMEGSRVFLTEMLLLGPFSSRWRPWDDPVIFLT